MEDEVDGVEWGYMHGVIRYQKEAASREGLGRASQEEEGEKPGAGARLEADTTVAQGLRAESWQRFSE